MGTPPSCVALTGATGFVGRHILAQLVTSGYRVKVLVRDEYKLNIKNTYITPIHGNLFNAKALEQLVDGTTAVIHIVGIIYEKPNQGQTFERIHVEGTQRLLEVAQKSGVKRWVQMSALGSRPDAVSRYHQTKWLAEEAVRQSGLESTIFRPSIIHGPDGEFMQMVKGFWCNRFPPFVPYFGSGLLGAGGAGRLQPVWVEDVARCFVDSLGLPKTIGECYPLGGPDVFTWPGLYKTCQAHLPGARKKKIIPVPVWYARLIAKTPGAPFNADQVVMSQEDSVCQSNKAEADFGFKFSPFEPIFSGYAHQIH